MNDQTPRRLKGSLVERAAEFYHFGGPELPPAPAASSPTPAPPTPVPPAMPAPPIPVSSQWEPAPEPVREEVAPLERQGPAYEFEAPTPAPLPISEPPGRHQGMIDRTRLAESGMLVPGAPIGVLAEEFRLVKRQLLLTARAVEKQDAGRGTDRSRMILVCSAQPNEGKTFCAINLALSMAAERDLEILLVDADFAKPDVLERLGLPAGPGLLDALAGSIANVEECIVTTDVPHLAILPAGTKSHADTELIASDRARAILDGLAAANPRRIVIFDSPPVLAASPAAVLALHVGQVMLVVRADQTSEGDLREAVSLLEGCEHIQLVLNAVSFQPGGRRFGSYYGESK